MTHKFIAGLACAALLSACASKPKPEPMAEPVAEAPRAPVVVEPEPVAAPAPAPAPVAIAAPAPNLPTPGTVDDFIYQSGGDSRVYFAYNQYRLSADALNSLRAQAEWLKTYTNATVVLEGNADERGTREYNLALGARRAESVKSYLVGQGVAPSRLTTVSYGKERPIDGRSSEEGWARNRNTNTNIVSGAAS